MWDMLGGGFPLNPIILEIQAMGIVPPRPPRMDASRMEALRDLWGGSAVHAYVPSDAFSTFHLRGDARSVPRPYRTGGRRRGTDVSGGAWGKRNLMHTALVAPPSGYSPKPTNTTLADR